MNLIKCYIFLTEEEMKRFQQALQEDGAYNSVSFSYDCNTPEIRSQDPQTTSAYENMQSGKCSKSWWVIAIKEEPLWNQFLYFVFI